MGFHVSILKSCCRGVPLRSSCGAATQSGPAASPSRRDHAKQQADVAN